MNAEASGLRKLHSPNYFFRRSKPSFQPSVPNTHLTSQTQTRDRSSALLPPQTWSLAIGRTPSETLYHHREEQCTTQEWMCMQQIFKSPQKFTSQANMAHGQNHSKQFQSPQALEPKTNSIFFLLLAAKVRSYQNKFHSLTPRTTKHFQCFSYHPKTSLFQKTNRQKFFFIWMLHGSTKVVVRAVALLSAKTKEKVANSLKKCFRESNILETNKQQTPTT